VLHPLNQILSLGVASKLVCLRDSNPPKDYEGVNYRPKDQTDLRKLSNQLDYLDENIDAGKQL
jgi:hypothetical protein